MSKQELDEIKLAKFIQSADVNGGSLCEIPGTGGLSPIKFPSLSL